jgi:hypothetical protein
LGSTDLQRLQGRIRAVQRWAPKRQDRGRKTDTSEGHSLEICSRRSRGDQMWQSPNDLAFIDVAGARDGQGPVRQCAIVLLTMLSVAPALTLCQSCGGCQELLAAFWAPQRRFAMRCVANSCIGMTLRGKMLPRWLRTRAVFAPAIPAHGGWNNFAAIQYGALWPPAPSINLTFAVRSPFPAYKRAPQDGIQAGHHYREAASEVWSQNPRASAPRLPDRRFPATAAERG